MAAIHVSLLKGLPHCATSDGGGYWIVSANGSVITEGDAPYEGGANSLHLNGAIIAGTGW